MRKRTKKPQKISPFENLTQLLEQYRSSKNRTLRFGFSHASVSEIAQQYYCEMQLEMINKYGRIETEAMITGAQSHEGISKYAEEVEDMDVVRQQVASGRIIHLLESLVLMKYKDVFVLGVPDRVVFTKNKPYFVIEHKFSHDPHFNQSHHVQANLYCLILNQLGFNTANLYYIIVVTTFSCKDCLALKEERIISTAKKKKGVIIKRKSICPECKDGNIIMQSKKFDKKNIVEDLEWALDYWLKRRDAIPTKKVWKCRACKYNSKCPASLFKKSSRE